MRDQVGNLAIFLPINTGVHNTHNEGGNFAHLEKNTKKNPNLKNPSPSYQPVAPPHLAKQKSSRTLLIFYFLLPWPLPFSSPQPLLLGFLAFIPCTRKTSDSFLFSPQLTETFSPPPDLHSHRQFPSFGISITDRQPLCTQTAPLFFAKNPETQKKQSRPSLPIFFSATLVSPQHFPLQTASLIDTTKRLMSSPKCRSVEVINNPARLGSNHREVNYINYK